MAAAALLSTAHGLFRGSSLASSYTIDTGPSRQSAVIGLWTIQKALHKNGKVVSIWTFDKSVLTGSRTRAKLDAVVEVLKKEVTLRLTYLEPHFSELELSHYRYPC
jgi:hypothetical protein